MKNVRRKSRGAVRTDQRKKRSDVPFEAACLYLEAAAQQSDARALALASEDGLLIAGTRGEYDLDGLAALGAACVSGAGENARLDGIMETVAPGEDLYVLGIKVAENAFCLTSVGRRVRSVKEAAVALTRILSPLFENPESASGA